MFTPLFAIGILPAWIANWRGMNPQSQYCYQRPQQVYVNSADRSIQIYIISFLG
jgi:citrate synthase